MTHAWLDAETISGRPWLPFADIVSLPVDERDVALGGCQEPLSDGHRGVHGNAIASYRAFRMLFSVLSTEKKPKADRVPNTFSISLLFA